MDLNSREPNPAIRADRILTTLREFSQLARENGLVPPTVAADDLRRLEIVATGRLSVTEGMGILAPMLPAIAAELMRVATEAAKLRRNAPATKRTLH